MKIFFRLCCWLYDRILCLYDDTLLHRHREEMRFLFRRQLAEALRHNPAEFATLCRNVATDTFTLVGPTYFARLRLLTGSTLAASALVICFLLGFCSFSQNLVQASTGALPLSLANPDALETAQFVRLPSGHEMFLECSGPSNHQPTVILATGAGLGSYRAWSLVQSQVAPFAHVCSYDPLGAGSSDHVPTPNTIASVVDTMHQLFRAASLPAPFLLVGASAGGVLIRRYEQLYPSEVAGFVFVDSAHEEQEWRDAAISPSFDLGWNNLSSLAAHGVLPPNQTLTWHDDVPLIVLERTDLPPCGAFPTLTRSQCDQINETWHRFQIDLAQRSRYGQLRLVPNSGHAMHQQQPQAIAQAIHDVLVATPLYKRPQP